MFYLSIDYIVDLYYISYLCISIFTFSMRLHICIHIYSYILFAVEYVTLFTTFLLRS